MKADEARVVDDLVDLVTIPSITGSERRIQSRMAELFDEATLEVDVVETDPEELARDPDFPGLEVPRTELPVVAGRLRTGRPGPRLLLVGHVDVVPPGDETTWTTPPFAPEIRDGAVYGRGACDMKGGVVAALEAIRLVVESEAELTGEVTIVAVPAEEDGGSGALAAIRAGYVGDACIITEPTELRVVVAHAGAITFTLTVPGRAAHASTRLAGASALEHLIHLTEALAEDERRRNEETHPLMRDLGLPYPTIIGVVEGGSWASMVMDRVEADGRYGVRLGQSSDDAAAELRSAVEAAAASHPFLAEHPVGLEVWGGRFDSSSVPSDHPLPIGLAAAHSASTGLPAELVGVPYGADMRLFINQGETPTVMYGPGDIRVAHAADEHVPVDQVVTCAEVLARWILDTAG